MSDMKSRGMGVDDFLGSGNDYKRGSGSFLTGWKREGKATVFVNRGLWAARSWNHPIPKVIELTDGETKEKVLVVRSTRWGCHEAEELLTRRYDRDRETGEREVPPCICPSCLLPEVVMDLVEKGELSWTQPIFRWEGAEEELVIRAAGVYNGFSAKGIDSDRKAIAELRKLKIRRDEAWNQSFLVRMQWLFYVCDASKPDGGLVKSYESKSLGEKMKKAIRDEMRRNAPNQEKGDPTKNPYPFEWTYDDSAKNYNEKYGVLALTNERPSKEILETIEGQKPTQADIDEELAPGSCWALKDELETHLVAGVSLPWERIFGPAEKAGLMVPPSDSKEDSDEDEDEPKETRSRSRSAPEVGRGKVIEAAALEVIEVGPEHDIWYDDAKPDPKVKGKRVELEPPDENTGAGASASDEEIAVATRLLMEWGAKEVALVVECDHCLARMTDDVADCPHCRASYDEAGKLSARPCLTDPSHSVPMIGDGPRFICEKCGAIHQLRPEAPGLVGLSRWEQEGVGKEAPPAGRRRRLPFDQPAAAKK